MKSRDVYERLLVKVEASESGIAVDRFRAVLAINEAQNSIVQLFLNQKQDDGARNIQTLLNSKEVKLKGSNYESYNFYLPENLFEFSSANNCKASNDICQGRVIDLFEIKDQNSTEILRDEFNKPSFSYREAPFTIKNNCLNIYIEDFKIDSVEVSYYRYPVQIKLIDDEDPESDFDENYQLEFDDKIVDRIVSMAASNILLNNKDTAFQAQIQKAVQ